MRDSTQDQASNACFEFEHGQSHLVLDGTAWLDFAYQHTSCTCVVSWKLFLPENPESERAFLEAAIQASDAAF